MRRLFRLPHKGREKDSDLLDAEAYYDGNDAAHNLCSKDGGNIVSSGNRLHARYIGEADSQNDREGAAQLKIPEFDKGEELKQCADSGTKQSSLTLSPALMPATPATIIDGVTHPTIMATTCCRARGSACPKEGMPFSSKTDACFCVTDEFKFDIISS